MTAGVYASSQKRAGTTKARYPAAEILKWNGGGNREYCGQAVTPRDANIYMPEPAVAASQPRRALRLARRVLLVLLVLAAAVAAFVAMMATRTAILPTPPGERVWAVAVAIATPETLRPRIPLFGQAVAGRSVDLRPLVAGHIAAVGPDFAGLNAVKRQQKIYAILGGHIASGAIHAVSMNLKAPDET